MSLFDFKAAQLKFNIQHCVDLGSINHTLQEQSFEAFTPKKV
jgi:hypothetical protein